MKVKELFIILEDKDEDIKALSMRCDELGRMIAEKDAKINEMRKAIADLVAENLALRKKVTR